MKPSVIYLLLAVLGTVLPYSQALPFIARHSLDVPLAAEQLFANRISAFFGLDVLVSAVALLCFVGYETRRQPVRGAWLSVAGTLLVGVSFGLPLFLWLRERQRAAQAAPTAAR